MIARPLLLLAAIAGGGCKKDHCGPAAAHHAELFAPLLQTWGVDAASVATFADTFQTLQCGKTDAPAAGLDCIRDAATLEAAMACVNEMTSGAGDWKARIEAALATTPVARVAELDAYAAKLVAAGQAAQVSPDPATPMRCPPQITKLHFVDFRLISAIARKKDQAVRHEDVIGDRDLEDFTAFMAKKTPNAGDVYTLRAWIAHNAGKALAVIHVAKLERPTVAELSLAEGEFVGGTLDAAISVVDDAGKVVCRTPVYAASSASLGYAYDPRAANQATNAERRVTADFEDKIPEALAKARATLLGVP